ncbi:AraC family transcriptional regulator [Actinoplanes sp. NEAU-A12]|uniref:AraC family transcriptional regulator n=1 Tax=Actinoplanes sandaracinus TaxID=3045177 RepID=A0ABT6WQ15_9ACTN|nr:AraC family transcriptional regulator [Actinoplanes sandaracinus]MDI6101828.1 AraC family transcriptional regulator [Actinoplanes sandaracinus]
MDVLSDVLAVMRTGRVRSAQVAWHAPWAQEFAPVPGSAGFHVVLRGSCRLLQDGAEPLALGAGDIVFRPHGGGHVLADSPGTRPVAPACDPAEMGDLPAFAVVGSPASADATVTLCGAYELDPELVHPLIADLPELIHVPAQWGRHPHLRATVDLLAAELATPGAGSAALIPALLDTMLVYLLRTWLVGEHPTGWAAALADPVTGAALQAIHREPERDWTVAALAAEGGLSRAPFARRFTDLLGRPPMTYLTWWRLTVAAGLLRRTDTTVGAIAGQVGYGSEFAFAAAFKRRFGIPPGRYRRHARG